MSGVKGGIKVTVPFIPDYSTYRWGYSVFLFFIGAEPVVPAVIPLAGD